MIVERASHRDTLDACVGWTGALGKHGRLVLIGYNAADQHESRCRSISMATYEQRILGSVGATMKELKLAVELVGAGKV